MTDYEFGKQGEVPNYFVFPADNWKEFYATLADFNNRVCKQHGLDPLDIVTPTGQEEMR